MSISKAVGIPRGAVIVGKTRVILTTDHYQPCKEDPQYGSRHECGGLITGFCDPNGDYDVRVSWDNGTKNAYKLKHLTLEPTLNKTDPNQTFKQQKKAKEEEIEHNRMMNHYIYECAEDDLVLPAQIQFDEAVRMITKYKRNPDAEDCSTEPCYVEDEEDR